MKINTSVGEINLRPYTINDVVHQINYLYDSPKEFLDSIGIDTNKFPGRKLHQKTIEKNLKAQPDSDFKSIVAELEGEIIGIVHLHLGEDPKAHFHILSEAYRGRGLGKSILKNSLVILMKKHKLDELKVEPKIDNIPMNRLMEKLGFPFLGRTPYNAGSITRKFEANSYLVELSRLK